MQPGSNGSLRQVACAEATSSDCVEFLQRITPGDPWQGATLFSIACVFRCSHREAEKSSAAGSRFPNGTQPFGGLQVEASKQLQTIKNRKKTEPPGLDLHGDSRSVKLGEGEA